MNRPRSGPLALAALALFTIAALSACERSEAGAGRTLRCRMSEDPPTLDPALATDTKTRVVALLLSQVQVRDVDLVAGAQRQRALEDIL